MQAETQTQTQTQAGIIKEIKLDFSQLYDKFQAPQTGVCNILLDILEKYVGDPWKKMIAIMAWSPDLGIYAINAIGVQWSEILKELDKLDNGDYETEEDMLKAIVEKTGKAGTMIRLNDGYEVCWMVIE